MTTNDNALKMLVLSLTGACNFSCTYCYAADHSSMPMTPKTACAAIDLAAASGEPFVLQFSGGEPLLNYPTLAACIDYVQSKKIRAILQLQTNGALLTPEIAAALKKGRVGIGVSLDGRPECNDRFRRLSTGEPASQHILEGIRLLAAQNIEIGLTCVVTEHNATRLTEIVEMAYFLGNVRRIGFDLLRGQGRGNQLIPASPAQIRQGLLAARQKSNELAALTGKKLLISQVERVATLHGGSLLGFGHCHAMNGEAAFVDASGEIYACASLVGNETFRLGCVADGICRKRQAKIMFLIRQSMDFCRSCSDFTLCGGGCFARWYGANRSGAYETECSLKRESIHWWKTTQEDQK